MRIKIPLVKKSIACRECKFFRTVKEEAGAETGRCDLWEMPTEKIALKCRPKKSWKAK